MKPQNHQRRKITMPNQLTRVIDAIKQDPHGETARQVSHWLAVNVMGCKIDEIIYREHSFSESFKKVYVLPDGTVLFSFKPLTDANHTRMLVFTQRLYPNPSGQGYYLLSETPYTQFPLNAYDPDTTHDACQVLRKCHAEGTLTDDILKGF